MMIATLTGIVAEKLAQLLVLDVRGVGYGVLLPASDHGAAATGESLKLYIYEHIKEDAHDLFGFRDPNTKLLFEQLLSVKNVGPKVALAVLDIGTPDAVRQGIASGDLKFLQTAKGVGKRAAEQIVVELRDKVGLLAGEAAESLVGRGGVNLQDEALQALVSLGYPESEAAAVLSGIDGTLPTEDRIRLALRGGH
jgi:Holliday junction DNA helicase RuvA